MSAPTLVDELTIHHDDDTITVHTDAGYYPHKAGLDVVDQDGQYVARYGRHQFYSYTALSLAPA